MENARPPDKEGRRCDLVFALSSSGVGQAGRCGTGRLRNGILPSAGDGTPALSSPTGD